MIELCVRDGNVTNDINIEKFLFRNVEQIYGYLIDLSLLNSYNIFDEFLR